MLPKNSFQDKHRLRINVLYLLIPHASKHLLELLRYAISYLYIKSFLLCVCRVVRLRFVYRKVQNQVKCQASVHNSIVSRKVLSPPKEISLHIQAPMPTYLQGRNTLLSRPRKVYLGIKLLLKLKRKRQVKSQLDEY